MTLAVNGKTESIEQKVIRIRQGVCRNFEELKAELREDFSSDDKENEPASLILDTVGEAIAQAN